MTDRRGQVFGNYRLTHLLGQGGFADVYLGEHVHLNTWAAIKVLQTQLTSSDVLDFRNEARMIAHLEHPHIVQVLDFGVEDNTPFLVMAYAPGGTLRQRHPRGVPLASESIVLYVNQVASALQYAHNQKLIHRDIKPENMLLGRNNEVLLSDFGIALVTLSARPHSLLAQSTSDPAGTVTYMAPEQIQGRPVQASDQYALGVVVYEWLTGMPPFHGTYTEIALKHVSVLPPSLRERIPMIPPDVEKVVLTALAKDPQQRFASVQAFANALEQACQRQPPPLMMSQPHRSPSVWANPSGEPPMEAALFSPSGRMILDSSVITIGREPTNQLVINNAKVSSHHAEIRPIGQGHSIVDLNSTNGTFVNEQRLAPRMPHLLNWGDTIRVGDTKLSYAGGSTTQKKALDPDGPTERTNSSGHVGVFAPVVPPPSHTGYGGGGQQVYQSAPPSLFSPPPPPPLNALSGVPIRPSNNVPPEPPAYQPQSQSPQERGSMARSIILAVMALVIILGGIGAFFMIHNNQIAQQNINATATAQANTNAHATATANAHATATAAVNATATAVVTSHYPPFTNLALYDPLTSSNSQWNTGSACQFMSAGYQVSIAQVSFLQWCLNKTQQFGELAYQATMNIQQGDCGGLVFRYVDSNNFYLFEVCQNGTYNLSSFISGKWYPLYSNANKFSSVIHQGANQSNVIAVTVQGDTVNMYVNGQNIDIATSTTLTSSTFNQGQIGLLADDTVDPTSVTYTNVLAWTAS